MLAELVLTHFPCFCQLQLLLPSNIFPLFLICYRWGATPVADVLSLAEQRVSHGAGLGLALLGMGKFLEASHGSQPLSPSGTTTFP